MKVLIADKFESSGIDALKKLGFDVISKPDAGADGLPQALAEANPETLIVRSTKVKAAAFEGGESGGAKNLSLIVRAGAGVDNIDMPAASAKGVYVANCPGKNAIAVAELVWSLILSCDRRVPDQVIDLRAGKWNKKEYAKARGLYGRTLGVVGLGTIGREVAIRGRAFGMKVLAWSRSLTAHDAEAMGLACASSPLEIARAADVISVNVAATKDTDNLCNAAFFDALKPGAIFINTSRGSVVDEPSLLRAIKDKSIRAGLDVFQNEPPAAGGNAEWTSETSTNPHVYGTHHIGASTDQAQQAIADETVRILRHYKETGAVLNCVNLCAKSPATRLLVIRHLNRPGVLAHVIGEIGKAGINIEEMENVIYSGADAACARIRLDAEPSRNTMDSIAKGSPHVLGVSLNEI
ncbi:MAG TPA: 3-phosphoglycerate dehydrogenase family protein [Phycisphaerales bacterium]|nr:3-phosphoglycerate dehydrogenase family protein [Phycisphaerales bacterium]